MMLYLLICLGYIGLRQEFIPSPYKGYYTETDSSILYTAAFSEVLFKTLFAQILFFMDAVNLIAKLSEPDVKND